MGSSNDLSNVTTIVFFFFFDTTTIDIWNGKLKLENTKSPNLQKSWGLTVWKGEVHEVDADTSQSKINNFEALKITKKHPKEEETQGEAKTQKST